MFDFRKLKRNRVWSIAVYVEDSDFSFKRSIGKPRVILNAKRRRRLGEHVHTYADPFLFPHGDELFLFFESQAVGEPGKIEVKKTSDLVNFEYVGEVLREAFHLSFPFVFRYKDEIYLMPESLATAELALYRFTDFPTKVVKERVLLRGAYKDSSLVCHNDIWYFFTTSQQGLELYYTEDLLEGHLIPHKHNPLTNDLRYSQCGGSPVRVDGNLFRIAQDCSGEYGRNISILQIDRLEPSVYEERLVADDYFDLRDEFNARGGHHLSCVRFRDKIVIAVDGKQDDLFVNKILSPIYNTWRGVARLFSK